MSEPNPSYLKRMFFIGLMIALTATGVVLVAGSMRDAVIFFYTPSDLLSKKVPMLKQIRLGGLVDKGSFQRVSDGLAVTFGISDLIGTINVKYSGALPDLFREGRGVVVQGYLKDETFYASQVLTKHDETYRPPNVVWSSQKS